MSDSSPKTEGRKSRFLSPESIFMLCVGSVAGVVGFGYTFMQAKKNELKEITSHSTSAEVREQVIMMKDGTRIASRAFAYSWLWSIGGVSLITYTIWKCSGAKDFKQFRQKAGEVLPSIPKSDTQGRNDFESLQELADYIHDEDRIREKELKHQRRCQADTK